MKIKKHIVCVGLLAPVMAGADEVSRSIDAHPTGIVSISNVAGSVEVIGWSRNEVDVEADLGSGVEELIVERDGDDVEVRVKVPRNSARRISSDLVVRVPEGSSVDIGVVSADIDVDNVLGELNLHAVSGDIEVEVYAGDFTAEVVSGDMEIEGNGNAIVAQLQSVSGDIEIEGISGEIDANSVSGDLGVTDGEFERVRVETVNGDLTFHAGMTDGGRFDAESINGELDVHFVGSVSARFDIETFNGRIRNCFGPEAKRTSRYAPGRELKFSEGDGASRVTLNTLNGSLTLCKD